MKLMVSTALVLFLAGCAMVIARKPREVLRDADGFTMVELKRAGSTDGAGDLRSGDLARFMEFGADSVFVAAYMREMREYRTELVAFSDGDGAYGAFDAGGVPEGYPLNGPVRARRGDDMVQGVSGRYVMTVTPGTRGTMDDAEQLLFALAENVKGIILTPELYRSMPERDRIEGSELYFRGSLAFGDRHRPDMSKVLLLDRIVEGTSALYDVGGRAVTLFVVRFQDAETARMAMNRFLKTRADRPIIEPGISLEFFTVFESDRSESYVAVQAASFFLLLDSPEDAGQPLFEYVLRGGTS